MSESSPLRYLAVEDFRRQHGLGRARVYRALERGELPHVRVGRKILIPANALDLMLVSARVPREPKGGSTDEAA